jgi:hypothetical protein
MRAAIAIAIVALAVAAPAAEAKPAKPCSRKGSTTVRATKSVRVYKVKNSQGGFNLIGCLRSDNKRQTLAQSYNDGLVTSGTFGHVTVAGRFVAWEFTAYDNSCKADCPPGYDPYSIHLSIRDLRKRKTVHVNGDVAPKGRLVLTSGGSIAWTQNTATDVEVNAYDAAKRHQLDHGDIPPGSLSLDGNVAGWTNGGAPQSAVLAPRT